MRHLFGLQALALQAEQRGLHRLQRGLAEAPLACAAEIVRCLEQTQQRRRLALRAGRGVEIVASEIGEAEFLFGGELPGQVEVDVRGDGLRGREQRRRRRLLEAQQHVGGLELDPLAGLQFDLQRGLGLGHDAAGQESAAFLEERVHRLDCGATPGIVRAGLGLQTVRPHETSITAPLT